MKFLSSVLMVMFLLSTSINAEPDELTAYEKERKGILSYINTKTDEQLYYLLMTDGIETAPVSALEREKYWDVYSTISAAISPTSPDTRLHMVRSLLDSRTGSLRSVNSIPDPVQKQRIINIMVDAGTRTWAETIEDLCGTTFVPGLMEPMDPPDSAMVLLPPRSELIDEIMESENQEIKNLLLFPLYPSIDPLDPEENRIYNDMYGIIENALAPLTPNAKVAVLRVLIHERGHTIEMVNEETNPEYKKGFIKNVMTKGAIRWERKKQQLCGL